jgi:hypothetical protein
MAPPLYSVSTIIPEQEQGLPTRTGGGTVSGSKGQLLWALRQRPDFRDAAIAAIASRRMGAIADTGSCTPVTSKFTRLVAVLVNGVAVLERRLYARDYPTVKVKNVSFKAHWLCWAVDHMAQVCSERDADMQLLRRFLTEEVSHLCGKRGCFSANHTILESGEINLSRQTCHGQRLTDHCPHNPKCIRTPMKSDSPAAQRRRLQ